MSDSVSFVGHILAAPLVIGSLIATALVGWHVENPSCRDGYRDTRPFLGFLAASATFMVCLAVSVGLLAWFVKVAS